MDVMASPSTVTTNVSGSTAMSGIAALFGIASFVTPRVSAMGTSSRASSSRAG